MSRTTPNLGLTVWNLGTDFFNHGALATDWDAIDAHDHSAGKGALISAPSLASSAVTTAKIADLAVITAKLADASVTTAKLADGSVTTAKLADAAITAAKLLDAAATSAKLAPTIGIATSLVNTSTSGTAYVDANTMTFTPARAARSLFLAVIMGGMSMATGGDAAINMKLVVDGTDQSFIPGVTAFNSGTLTPTFPFTVAGVWTPTLTAASHTVKTQIQAFTSGTPGTLGLASGFLLRIELGS